MKRGARRPEGDPRDGQRVEPRTDSCAAVAWPAMLRVLRAAVAVGVAALVLPSVAVAATATITDPGNDFPPSFEQTTDLVRLDVVWNGTLSVSATYKEPPSSAALRLLVSAASKDEDDVTVKECDPQMVDSLTVTANSEQAVLEVSRVEGVLTAAPQWNGTTVSYSFSSPTLNQVFAPGVSDPFACGSGSADEDDFYGSFAGKVLKLTPQTTAEALTRELARRYGSRLTTSPRRQVRCPRRGILKATEPSDDSPGMAARALCNFEFSQTARTTRAGSASVSR